ncbi:MAG: sulfoxide reductase heme-binding subunit YedZ [Oleispira sp.]|jgi:sulfoxide reductase heme-binding subunit YedZ
MPLLIFKYINQHDPYFRACLFLLSLWPVTTLSYHYYSGFLGFNPYEELIKTTGKWAIIFLMLSLSITPVRRWLCWLCTYFSWKYGKRLSDWNFLIKSRRMIGLFSFAYATCHFVVYIHFDLAWDLLFLYEDILDRQFLQLGLLCFFTLVPLAITSYGKIRKKMGKHWRRMHRSAYFAGILAVLHYYSLAKVGNIEPLYYVAVLTVLLGHRILVRWHRDWYKKVDNGMEVKTR